MELIKTFLNLIYSQKCIICSCAKPENYLCKTCLKDVEMLSGFKQRVFDEIPIYCAYIYSKNIKKLIRLLKFSHKKKAAKALSHLLFDYYKKLGLSDNFIIIYPPSLYLKTASRGYNPIKLIAQGFSRFTGFSVEDNLIKKIKYTLPQYKAKNRKKNIMGSFKIDPKKALKLKEKSFLLIDDIITTGATIEELIKVLKESGINNITVLTIAKAGVQ